MRPNVFFFIVLVAAVAWPLNAKETKNYELDGPAPGSIRFRWIHGSVAAALNRDPRVQVQGYNEDTFILRENICVNFEAPFMYLLLGNERALLIDTGATANPNYFPLRATVDAVLKRWCTARKLADIPLTVVLTSPEDDVQNLGYSQFVDRPNTTLAPLTLEGTKTFYGLTNSWPNENAKIDLGGRIITVIPTPGAHKDGLTFYDPYNDFLHTGELIGPARIMIANERDFIASIAKLKSFAEKNPVKWIMGGQVEMSTTPGLDYIRRKTYRPSERALQLEPSVLDDLHTYAAKIVGRSEAIVRAEYILLNGVGPGTRTFVRPSDLPPPPPPTTGGSPR
jgi:glyoxylase-like metal-dependent hydrolase (beta-lactamase superfamily II)